MSGLPTGPRPHDAAIRRFDWAILATIVAPGVGTAAIRLDPRIPTRVVSPYLDIAINVAATLVGGLVAALG